MLDTANNNLVATARALWVPAVNNDGGFGRWAYVEIEDPWEGEAEIMGVMNHR